LHSSTVQAIKSYEQKHVFFIELAKTKSKTGLRFAFLILLCAAGLVFSKSLLKPMLLESYNRFDNFRN